VVSVAVSEGSNDLPGIVNAVCFGGARRGDVNGGEGEFGAKQSDVGFLGVELNSRTGTH